MIVHIDFDDLKTIIMYEDRYFKKDGYKLSLLDIDADSLEEFINTSQNIFFQNEIIVDKNILENLNLDYTTFLYELINLLFDNVEKVVALQKTIKIPFSDISDEGNDLFKDMDGNGYMLLYDNELMATAREYFESQAKDTSLEELIGSADNIQFYLLNINTEKLVELIKQEVDNDDVDFNYDLYDNDEDIILAYSKEFEDIIEIVDDNNLFDYDSYVNGYIDTLGEAVSSLEGIYGDFLGSQINKINNIKPQEVNIFRYDI